MGYNSGIKVFIFLFITKEKPTYCIIFLNNLYLYREFECKKMRFDELDLEDAVLDGLYDMNFDETTPVQELTIPVILEGKDIIACAQTGTGKTAAYVLPVINELSKGCHPTDAVNAVIMAPTRELAQQIDQQIQGFTYFIPSVSAVAVYGGTDGIAWEQQKRGLEMGADIVIATPGRLLSHIKLGTVDLSKVSFFVLDEADRMLDMGFYDDIMQVHKQLPPYCQTIMFSATLPPKIRELARQILRKPVEINIAVSKPNEAIEQGAYVLYETQKLGLIKELFAKPLESKTIIFSSSKLKVKELAFAFKRMHLNAAAMHSDLDQAKREEVMLDFKNGKIDLLVATDIVARGIDIEDIGMVVNYDVPHDPEDYIHRIGRTARASATGRALTFVNEKEQGKFRRIEEFMEREVEKLPLPEKLGKAPAYEPSASGDRRGRGGRKGRGEAKGRGGRAGERPKAAPREAVPDSGAASPAIAGTEGVEGRNTERRRHRGGRHRRRGRKPAEGAPAVQGGGDASDRGGNA